MDDHLTTEESPRQPSRIGRPVAVLLAVSLFVVLARGYLALVQGRQSDDRWRLAQEGELGLLVLAAVVVSLIAAVVGRKYLNRLAALLLAVTAGGLATATHNGLIGATVGTVVGLLLVSRWVRRLTVMTIWTLLATVIGTISGVLALWLDPDLSDGPSLATLVALCACALAGGAVLFWPTRRRRAVGRRGALPRAALLLPGIVGLWPSLSIDMYRRANHLAATNMRRSMFVRPYSARWLWPGPLAVSELTVNEQATDDDLRALRGWKELQYLTIQSEQITDDGLASLENLTSLEVLSLNSDRVTDAGIPHLLPLIRMTSLELHRAQISGSGLRALGQAVGIWQLSLDNSSVGDDDLPALRSFNRMFILSLNGTRVTDRGIPSLTALPRLKYLRLGRTAITDIGLAALSHLTTLRELYAFDTGITGEGLAEIDPSNHLDGLHLQRTTVTDRGLARLTVFSTLTTLDLGGTRITDGGLAHLAGFRRLQELSIWGTPTTDSGLENLRSCWLLLRLDLSATQVTDEGVDAFHRAVPGCHVRYTGTATKPSRRSE